MTLYIILSTVQYKSYTHTHIEAPRGLGNQGNPRYANKRDSLTTPNPHHPNMPLQKDPDIESVTLLHTSGDKHTGAVYDLGDSFCKF